MDSTIVVALVGAAATVATAIVGYIVNSASHRREHELTQRAQEHERLLRKGERAYEDRKAAYQQLTVLRHGFASALIVDLGLDPVQVARQLGHARPSLTLETYSHLFDRARHAENMRERLAASGLAAAVAHLP